MQLAIALFFAFIITLLFIFALRPVALAVGLVDTPGGRKKHRNPTPVIGGIAMYFGLVFGAMLYEMMPSFSVLLVGGSLLIVVGVIDDGFDLPPSVRLIAQTSAALVMVYGANLNLSNIGTPLFFDFELGAFAIPFTILVTLTVINAFNTIDGIDGLAGGVAFIALGFMAVFSVGSDKLALAMLLMSVVAGFLICNIPIYTNQPVKSFMGDAGSTFLGFAVAWLGISLSQDETVPMSAVTGLWMVALPIYDVFTSMLRRIIRRKSPFKPDRDHLHHVLIGGGLSAKMTLLIILFSGIVTAFIGLIGEIFSIPDGVMFLLWGFLGMSYFMEIAFFRGKRLINLINKVHEKQISWLT